MSEPTDGAADNYFAQPAVPETVVPPGVAPVDGLPEYGAPADVDTPILPVASDPVRGVLAGIGVAILGALVWTIIGYVTGYEIGFAAVVLGIGVGFVMHRIGGRASTGVAIGAVVIAVLGCVLGFLMLDIALSAKFNHASFFDVFSFVGTDIGWPTAVKKSLSDVLRVAFLAFAGFSAFRQVSQQSR